MKRYLRVYRQFFLMNVSRLLIYRSNFINNLLSSSVWAVFAFITIILLTGKTQTIGGWNRSELMLLTAIYSILIGLFHTFLTRNFERMPIVINKGLLDSVLLMPIDAQFVLTTRLMNFTSLIRVVAGLVFVAIILTSGHISINVIGIIGVLMLLLVGLLLLYTIWFLVLTFVIYNPQLSNLVDLMFTVSSFGKYPRGMFQVLPREFFLAILPLTFVSVPSVQMLLGRMTPFEYVGLFGYCTVLFVVTRVFWLYSLRHYTSASS